MKIHDLAIKSVGDTSEISAALDDYRIWYRFPAEYDIRPSGDPFLASALPEAMSQDEPLEIDASAPISPGLLSRVAELQDIYHCWNDELKTIGVQCATAAPRAPTRGVTTFYSGGLDSTYTLVRHLDDITHLIHIAGFDFLDPPESVARRIERQRRFAAHVQRTLLTVETNYRQYAEDRSIDWFLVHGNCLVAICLALGFERSYIPSTHTYSELFPWGSHPLLDPLWSNGRTEVIHDGAGARRTAKLRLIAQHARALENLTVCWRDANQNCGSCPKCLRTMVSLRLLSLTTSAMPPLADVGRLRGLGVRDGNELAYLEDNLLLAREVGDRRVLRKLMFIRRRYHMKELVAELDRVFLGRRLRRLYRAVKNPEWLRYSVTLGPKEKL